LIKEDTKIIGKELQVTDVSARIKDYATKWWEHAGRTEVQ